MLWKCCTQYTSKSGKLSSGHKTGKGQFSFQSQRMARPKNVQITIWLHSFHMPARLCSKSSKPGFSGYVNRELPDVQADLEKAEEPEIKLPTLIGSWRKQGSPRKTSTSVSLTMWKLFTLWITTNCGKFLENWEYLTTLPVSWETCMQVKKQQLELDMEQQTGSKLGKDYIKAVYCHPAYLTYMQNTSYERPGWMNHKLENKTARQISITSDMQMIQL